MQNQWGDMVEMQDKWEKLRRQVEENHTDMNTKLNPLFYMHDMRSQHPLARTKDYIKQERDDKQRVGLVKKKGMEARVEAYKEELRAYEYMMSRGYATEAKTQEQLQEIVKKF